MLLKELKFGELVKSNSVKSNFLTFNSLKISTPLWFLSSIGPLLTSLKVTSLLFHESGVIDLLNLLLASLVNDSVS